MAARIDVHQVAESPELARNFPDVDAHAPRVFFPHPAQGAAMNAEHRYLQFIISFQVLFPGNAASVSAYAKDARKTHRLTSLPPI